MKNKAPQNKPTFGQAFRGFNIRLALTLSALILVFLATFKLMKSLDLYLVAITLYTAITLAVALWYIIYNKGSVSGPITPGMLPADWSADQKQAFIDDLLARRKRSKWALLILIPMIIVFGFELLELYIFPPLTALLTALGFTVG